MIGKNNLGLITTRLQKDNPGGFITEDVITHKVFNSYDSNSIFPLYLYHQDGTKTANFKPEVLKTFTESLTQSYTPEEVLDYIYAVLYSPKYREQNKEFMKTDFPRIPAPKNDAQFIELAELGERLRRLHLLTSESLNEFETTYPVSGSDEVEKIQFGAQKVWINDKQYFGNVPEIAWNFYIGGFQPAQKWLKDRKGKKLANNDIEHYQKIIKVLNMTRKIMDEIRHVEESLN